MLRLQSGWEDFSVLTFSDQCHQIPATFLSEEGDAQDVPGSEPTESMLLH